MLDPLVLAPLLLTFAAAALCIRRGDSMLWLLAIFLLQPIGSIVYLVLTLGGLQARSLADRRKTTRGGLDRARADAARIDSAGAWEELAAAAFDRRRFAEAAEAAGRALAKQPGDLEALFLRGRSLLATGQPREAVESLAQVVAKKPDHANGDALFAYAQALAGSGDTAGARRELERLAERTSRADFLYELARVQLEAGDRVAAKTTLRRIVEEWAFVPKFVRSRVRPWVWRAKWRLFRLGAA
jgi:hypothetical protein